jgi:hypothetical protein
MSLAWSENPHDGRQSGSFDPSQERLLDHLQRFGVGATVRDEIAAPCGFMCETAWSPIILVQADGRGPF